MFIRYEKCTKDNLAPKSNEAVWNCIRRLIEHVYDLNKDLFVVIRTDGALVLHIKKTKRNLITIWPRTRNLAINLRASGPESLNRVNDQKVFSIEEFDKSFENFCNGINEVISH